MSTIELSQNVDKSKNKIASNFNYIRASSQCRCIKNIVIVFWIYPRSLSISVYMYSNNNLIKHLYIFKSLMVSYSNYKYVLT